MNNKSQVHFNKYGEIIGKGYDGENEYEYKVFNRQQIEAIKLLIQKYSGKENVQIH